MLASALPMVQAALNGSNITAVSKQASAVALETGNIVNTGKTSSKNQQKSDLCTQRVMEKTAINGVNIASEKSSKLPVLEDIIEVEDADERNEATVHVVVHCSSGNNLPLATEKAGAAAKKAQQYVPKVQQPALNAASTSTATMKNRNIPQHQPNNPTVINEVQDNQIPINGTTSVHTLPQATDNPSLSIIPYTKPIDTPPDPTPTVQNKCIIPLSYVPSQMLLFTPLSGKFWGDCANEDLIDTWETAAEQNLKQALDPQMKCVMLEQDRGSSVPQISSQHGNDSEDSITIASPSSDSEYQPTPPVRKSKKKLKESDYVPLITRTTSKQLSKQKKNEQKERAQMKKNGMTAKEIEEYLAIKKGNLNKLGNIPVSGGMLCIPSPIARLKSRPWKLRFWKVETCQTFQQTGGVQLFFLPTFIYLHSLNIKKSCKMMHGKVFSNYNIQNKEKNLKNMHSHLEKCSMAKDGWHSTVAVPRDYFECNVVTENSWKQNWIAQDTHLLNTWKVLPQSHPKTKHKFLWGFGIFFV
ncbi:hypothetical protein LguiB_013956 [Lonicera macranthoides]